MEIPQSLLMQSGLAAEHPEYGNAFRALKKEIGNGLDERFLLCLLLIVERSRGLESLWAPYIRILPETYGTV